MANRLASIVPAALLLLLPLAAESPKPGADDAAFEAAIHTETVTGDLKRAIDQYSAILAGAKANRPLAARALFQIAGCQEKLGLREAAHASYQRVLHEFGDQAEIAARAHQRLFSWTNTPKGPRNLNFERGAFGWSRENGSPVEMRRDGCRSAAGCAVVTGPGKLLQSFSAAAYRGRTVRLRAWLRFEPSEDAFAPGDHAQMWLAVDRDEPQRVTIDLSRWTPCEIVSEVDATAEIIQLGVVSPPKTRVWVDGFSFQVVPEPEINAARTAVQKLYGRLDAAYLQPDFDEIANLASPDAQYQDSAGKEPLRKAIERWTTLLAHHTSITAFKLTATGAIVKVQAEYVRSEANRTRSVSYVDTRLDAWVRTGAAWKLKEYRVLASRQVDSTTDAQTARRAAADLKRTAAPLATIEVGHTFYDLMPFGMAVGDARIVALGEALGTREFFQIKHRLFEYLVKEKGFTIFAINANWPEATALDQYIKHGAGDPKALLAGMLWPWNTEEALDVVQWMREFNQAPGNHPTLSFASFGIPPASVVIPQVVDYLTQCSPLDAVTAQADYGPLLEMESRLGEVYGDASASAVKAEEVVKLLDSKREVLVQSCSSNRWRDARQDAEMARQNAATRTAGRSTSYGNEMMARNIRWLANDAYPGEKIVLWGHNGLVGLTPGESEKSVGSWLREEFGEQVYITGFAFHRGELLAPGFQNGKYEGVAAQTIPESAEGNGDSVLSAAGMPVFFLDLRTVPTTTALGRWLAESHSFLEVGALWNRDDPQSNSHVKAMTKSYDGLIFLEEAHAAHGL